MKKSQVYFVQRCQVQNYEYNTTKGRHEFPFRNLLFNPFLLNRKSQVFRDKYFTKYGYS